MSLHKAAVTDAEKLAEHLEMNYGVQLDGARRGELLEEIESFFGRGSAEPLPVPPPPAEQVNVAVDAPAVAPDGPPLIEGA